MKRFHRFWRFWMNKTEQEKDFIIAMIGYTRVLLKKVKKKHIISIYVHGSFPRRDLRPGSDIDYKIITDDDADLDMLKNLRYELADEYKKKTGVPINLSFYTLTELMTGKFLNDNAYKRKLPPWKFVDHLGSAKLFYGQKLYEKDLHQKSAEEKLENAWCLAGRYLARPWGDKEISRVVNISKFVMDLIHQMDNYWDGIKTEYIKHEIIQRHLHEEKHIIHLLWHVIHNPNEYDTDKKREKVFKKIREFLKEVKDFCGCSHRPDP